MIEVLALQQTTIASEHVAIDAWTRGGEQRGNLYMSPWKKISALFVFSMSTALLGAGCVGQVEETTESQDPLSATEAPEATEEAESELSLSAPDHTWSHRRRLRCERECRREYSDCLRGGGHDWDHGGRNRCERRYNRCQDRCR